MGYRIYYEMSPGLWRPRRPLYYVYKTFCGFKGRLLKVCDTLEAAEAVVKKEAAFASYSMAYDKYGNRSHE